MSTSLGVTEERFAEKLIEFSWLMRLQAAMLDEEGDHIDAAALRAQASAYERAVLAA